MITVNVTNSHLQHSVKSVHSSSCFLNRDAAVKDEWSRIGEEVSRQRLQGRCAAGPVKAPSSEHMLLSWGYWPYYYSLHISWPLEIPTLQHSHTPAPSILLLCLCACVWGKSWGRGCLLMCMQVNICQSLRVAEAAAAPLIPRGPLCLESPKT